jgi:hypothetical protein
MARAEAFSWERVTERVEAYYGFVIRRLAASGSLPPDFRAEVPAFVAPRPSLRSGSSDQGAGAPGSGSPDDDRTALVSGSGS